MDWIEGPPLTLWAMAHAAGIVVALLSRLRLDGRLHTLARFSLPVVLLAVGAIAFAATDSASLAWVVSGATLGVMVIASVWEPLDGRPDPTLARLISAHEAV